MQIVFMGSGSFAVPIVRAIRNVPEDQLVAVVTQPDRPRGRGQALASSPVKDAMRPTGIPILTPEKVGDVELDLRNLRPDLIVVTDYGQYIPSNILAIPPRHSINVHPSLLPKYRGAAPIPWAIANGDTMTGVTIQYVTKKMDAGDILLQQEFEIDPDETSVALEKRLAEAGAALLLRALDHIRTGHIHATPQDDARATQARKLAKADGKIDWNLPAESIRNRIRAFQPWPGTFCESPRGNLKIIRADMEPPFAGAAGGKPGTVAEGPTVICGTGVLRLLEVQPEGKRPMTGAEAVSGRYFQIGEVLL